MRFVDCTQGSDSWKSSRAGVITASQFSTARSKLSRKSKTGGAGESSAKAKEYAWVVAIERIAGAPVGDEFETWAMRRGSTLEPEARMAYESATGLLANEAGIALTDDGRFGYSTDGFVGNDGMIEIKCPASCTKIGSAWANPDAAAEEYMDQMMGGMWITGREWCDLVIYCPWLEVTGKELLIRRVTRDDNYIEALEQDLIAFERLVTEYENILRTERAA